MRRYLILALLLAGGVYAANELVINGSISYNKNAAQIQLSKQASITVTGNTYCDTVLDVPTNETRVTICTGLTTPGAAYIQNLDTSNAVSIATTSTDYGLKLKASEWSVIRMASTNLYLKADTTNVFVRVLIFSD
jgi:hypothetical protein